MMKGLRILVLICLFLTSVVYGQQTQKYIHNEYLFDRGEEMIEKLNYTKAQHFFKQYIETDPLGVHVIDAQYYIGYCALHLTQDGDKGEKILLTWKDKFPKHPKAISVHVELAKFYYSKKKYKEAIAYYNDIDRDEIPSELIDEINFELAYSYFLTKDLASAGHYFDLAKRTNHQYTYAANYYSGYLKFKKKEYNQALKDFKTAEANSKYAKVVPFMVTNIYYQQGKDAEVIKYGTEILSTNKGGGKKKDIALLVAESYFNIKEYTNAFTYYDLSIGKKLSKDRSVNYKYAYAAFKGEKFSHAIKGFNLVLSKEDSLGQYAAYYLAQSYIKNNNKNAAIIALKRASKSDKNKKIQIESLYDLSLIHI